MSFVHPTYLWLLTALAVPLALHLLNRRQMTVVIFPSVRFLRVSRQPQDGRRRLRDVLLLLLRMLAYACAVLLLAEPHWRPAAGGTETSSRCAVLLVDASASMATGRRWETALAKARELMAAHDGAEIGLAVTAGERVVWQVPPTKEYWRLEEVLGGLRVTSLRGEPLAALKLSLSWLKGEEKSLEIISDFQTTDWERRWKLVPTGVRINLHDVKSAGESGNCGILNVQCQRLGKRRLRTVATVMNTSGEVQTRELSLTVDGVTRKESMSLPAQGKGRSVMVFDDVELGLRGEARLNADVYVQDDLHVFWADGTPPQAVLLAVDTTEGAVSAAEAEYVRAALLSETEGAGSRFTVAMAEADMLTEEQVKTAQAVFLLGSAALLQDDGAALLKGLLERGGVLFVTPGKAAAADLRRLREIGLPFGQMQGMSGQGTGREADGVGSVRQDSVLWPLYSEVSECDLYMFAIRRCCQLKAATDCKVHLESLAGRPLLLERTAGNGRCFLSAFGFAPWWGDFQLTNSFLPLLQELLLTSAPADFGRKRLSCGAPLTDDERETVDTDEPALHRVGNTVVEVNVDMAESAAQYVGELDMLDLLRGDEAAGEAAGVRDEMAREPLALVRWLAWLLLLGLLLEVCVACHSDFKRGVDR